MAPRWIERRFERLIWKFRLVSIVPVVLSLLGSVGCFVIGAFEVVSAFFVILRIPFSSQSFAAKTIAQMVGGVDYFVIGIALLIFGYGIYELVISDLEPRLEGGAEQHTNILSVNSLQSLKNNLFLLLFLSLGSQCYCLSVYGYSLCAKCKVVAVKARCLSVRVKPAL